MQSEFYSDAQAQATNTTLFREILDRIIAPLRQAPPDGLEAPKWPPTKAISPDALLQPQSINKNLRSIVASLDADEPMAAEATFRKIICQPCFLRILKHPSNYQAKLLRRIFSSHETWGNTVPAAATPWQTSAQISVKSAREADEIMPLVTPLIAPLRRYASKLTKNRADAEDLLQDCFERMITSWGQRRPDGSIRAWAFTIMRNLSFSANLRQSRRGIHMPIEDDDNTALAVPPLQEDSLLHRDLVKGMAALSEEHRKVLILVAISQLSYTAAARLLDIPIGTVRSRLARARENLAYGMSGMHIRSR